MKTMNESEFSDCMANKAVSRLRFNRNESGKYEIIINTTWKKGDFNLVTTRGTPRVWASLDRLTHHIREKYAEPFPPITLTLSK